MSQTFSRFALASVVCSTAVASLAFGEPASGTKDLEVVLRLKERTPMTRLADEVTNPRSPRYRKFYTPDEIRQVAAPTDEDYANLINELTSKGFKVVSESQSHLIVTVSGPKELFEQVFATRIVSDTRSSRHRNVQAPTIPADFNVVASVIGFDTTRSNRSHLKIVPGSDERAGGGLQPDYIKTAYGFAPIYQSGLSGKGQHIAIATYDGFHLDDVQAYYVQQKVSPAPSVDVVSFNGTAALNPDSAMETEVDCEFSGMIAPGAQIHVFASAHNDDPGEVQLFTAILDDNRAKIANYSWGDCEADIAPQHFQDMNTVFARAVAQGVNILAASGDSGAAGCPSQRAGAPAKVNADWPAANPYVFAIGGTSVTNPEASGADVQESAWDGSGGGISTVWALPEWQKSLGSPYTMRSFPDVAFNADPYTGEPAYITYTNNKIWMQIGGTSIAAPQWSGFMALVGEARAGLPALGYMPPVIYSMSAADRAAAFHDVTQGNNGGYNAGAGWDAVTGWGSMRANQLLDLLRKH